MRTVVFFGLLCLYLRVRVDPRLLYVNLWQDPAFFLTWRFFRESVARPGDLAQYAALFLSRFYAYPWAGALILTVLALLVSLATREFLGAARGIRPRAAHFVPALLLLMIFGRYSFSLASVVGLLAALGALAAYVRLPLRGAVPRATVFLASSVALYGVAAGPALVFVVLGGLHELIIRRRLVLGLACLLAGLAMPYLVGAALFGMEPGSAYVWQLPLYRHDEPLADVFSLCLFASLPLLFLWAAAGRFLRSRRQMSQLGTPPSRLSRFIGHYRTGWLGPAVETVLLLAAGALAARLSLDPREKFRLELEYCAEEGLWDELVRQAPRIAAWDPESRFLVHRGLYHTGQLLDRMLAYPQAIRGWPLGWWAPSQDVLPATQPFLRISDLWFELGRANACEHMASEALETQGARPRVLQRLALVCIAKRRPEAARIFLGALRADLVYGGWARDCLRQLDADPSLSSDPDVARLRASTKGEDHAPDHSIPPTPDAAEATLLQLLKDNPRNRMAFEYLIAHWLLTGQPSKVAARLDTFKEFGYAAPPKHVQEAVLHGWLRQPAGATDLSGMGIDPTLRTRFGNFLDLLRQHRGAGREGLREKLAPEFGDTLWYYLLFRESAAAAKLAPRTDPGAAR